MSIMEYTTENKICSNIIPIEIITTTSVTIMESELKKEVKERIKEIQTTKTQSRHRDHKDIVYFVTPKGSR
jgi:hypothetical protein